MWHWWHRKHDIKWLRRKLMADFSGLQQDIATLKTDAEALIAKTGVEDPTIQQNIDKARTDVQAIDTEIKTKLG